MDKIEFPLIAVMLSAIDRRIESIDTNTECLSKTEQLSYSEEYFKLIKVKRDLEDNRFPRFSEVVWPVLENILAEELDNRIWKR